MSHLRATRDSCKCDSPNGLRIVGACTEDRRKNGSADSVVVRPAAQFLGEGVSRLFREPTDLRAEGRPAGAAGFGDDLGAGDQFL